MTEAAFWFVHSVTVEPLLADGGEGQQAFGPGQQINCWKEDQTRFVHDPQGTRLVSMTTLYVALDDVPAFPPNSRVTLPDRVAFVIERNSFDSGSLALEVDHAEIYLS